MIVHAGYADDGIDEGVGRWPRTLEMLESDVPVLIENTAGGENAVGRRFDALAKLWDAIAAGKDSDVELGFCFDTCHAHSAGEDLSDAVERVLEIVGTIDLLHANDSKDPAGSGRDRHQNLGAGEVGEENLKAMIARRRRAGRLRDPGDRRRPRRRHGVRPAGALGGVAIAQSGYPRRRAETQNSKSCPTSTTAGT